MIDDPLFYLFAIPAVILLGLSKGGFSGVGSLALPLVALVISPVTGAAILLPLMIVQDFVGVWAWRRTWDGWVLGWMLPGVAVGILAGFGLAKVVSTTGITLALGIISIGFAVYRLRIERKGAVVAASNAPGWVGTLFGAASGFTSQIALAGSPPYQMFVMPRRLPQATFVGTTAIFFAANNLMKVPAFAGLGQFTREGVLTTLALLPLAILSTFAGVWVVRRIDAVKFARLIYLLMALVGARLVWVGLGL